MNQETLKAISTAVENAVDTKINGKLRGLKDQMDKQDLILADVKTLLEERKFLLQLWSFVKFLGGVAVAVGSAIILYRKL